MRVMKKDGIKEGIRKLLRCPVTERGAAATEQLRERLLHFWVEVVASCPYQVRDEGQLAIVWYETNLEDDYDTDEMEWDAHNMKGWIDKARRRFMKLIDPVVKMKVEIPEDRKHWPMRKLTDQDVIAESLKGVAMFLPIVTPHVLMEVMWLLMARFFEDFRGCGHKFYYVDFERDIGASRGQLVPWVRFDVDYGAAPHFHAYPVSEREFTASSSVRLSDFGAKLQQGKPCNAAKNPKNWKEKL